jgi:Rho termination factor, N-terminal domain
MATRKQTRASKRNIKSAQRAARSKRTIANLPKSARRELGRQGARGRARSGKAGRALEERNRQQLYQTAKRMKIPGRSRMGKWDLIDAIRKAS